MKRTINTYKNHSGFSLAEVLATLTIGAIILVAVLRIYSGASHTATSITERIEQSKLPSEILQCIAEDLDDIIASGSDTKIMIHNKLNQGYQAARMIIEKTFYGKENEIQLFEKIIWQSVLDYESETPGLVLYRSHSGINDEDKLLDKQKTVYEREYFVPVCSGVTLFKIEALEEGKLKDKWEKNSLPNAVVVTISFAELIETEDRTLDVPDTEKTKRTIAVDRTRRIRFRYVKPKPSKDIKPGEDVNDINDMENLQEPNEITD